MSQNTASLFNPSEPYLDSLEALMRNRDNEAYVLKGVQQIVQRGMTARSLPQRNRLWLDAVHLLRHDWSRTFKPDLLDRELLKSASASLPEELPHIEGLEALTKRVLEDTPADFESFQQSDEGKREFNRDDPSWLRDFHEWLDRYLPLALAKLPTEGDAADSELRPRIEWMINKVAPEHDDAAGHREALLDKAWMYARANWRGASGA